MESKLFLGLPSSPRVGRNLTHTPKRSSLVTLAVIATPKNNAASHVTETKTVYKDNWFDRTAIYHLSHSVQATTGVRSNKEGYEGLIEAATVVAKNHNPNKQQDLVIQALHKAFPKPILSMIRALVRPSKFTREFFAVFTSFFFPWLIGPCQVKESELRGSVEKNVVHIRKCRFLEGTNCVGMCVNLCKMPSQRFIKDSFGIPVNMVPNFEDMSCDMIFGQEPPPEVEDPAFKQPCYKFLYNQPHKWVPPHMWWSWKTSAKKIPCKAKQKHRVDCSS